MERQVNQNIKEKANNILNDEHIEPYEKFSIYEGLYNEVEAVKKPTHPHLDAVHSVQDVLEYAKKLESYYIEKSAYVESYKQMVIDKTYLDNLISDYIRKECGVNDVKIESRESLWGQIESKRYESILDWHEMAFDMVEEYQRNNS